MRCDIKKVEGALVERTGLVKNYLSTISEFELLTPEQERALFDRIKKGDQKAKDELINSHQRYVYAVAKRYSSRGKMMDLVQEANIGMITAIQHFNPDRGVRFLSFARYYIEREINTYLTNEDLMVRKSNNAKTTYRINKIKNDFFTENGRYPSADEMVEVFKEKYNIDIKEKSDVYDVKLKSINRTFDEDDENAFENSALFTGKTASNNLSEVSETQEYNQALTEKMLGFLDERSREILKLSFGIGCDRPYQPQEISEILDNALTGERVRQIKNAAISKLKKVCAHASEVRI